MITYHSCKPRNILSYMRHGKVVINLLIIVFVILLGCFALIPNKQQNSGFIRGYIEHDQDKKTLKYEDTLVRFNAPEPTWLPKETFGTANQPNINGASGVLVELNSGKILFEKDLTTKKPIASLAKVMTAIIAIEHKALTEKIYVSEKAASIGENTMGISQGEVYTLDELLHGLIMHSGNDAAYAISEGVAGDTTTFVEWMNLKSRELGLEDTYFADPSGLDDTSYSTPKDLVKLTRYALKYPELKKMGNTVEYELPENNAHKYIYLYNQTNLLTTYPGVKGFKTGYTEEAGLCLITYAENEGKEVIGVVLGSGDRKGDMILMLDHGFSTLGVVVEHNLL